MWCFEMNREAKHKLEAKPLHWVSILLFGIAMGVFSKYLDCKASNELPFLLEYLDVRNFLGRFSVWVLIGLWLSVSADCPGKAALRVLVFFASMVSAYYLYSKLAAGFFPKSYALVWFCFTLVSPLLGIICWYGKGMGAAAFLLSVILLGLLFWCSFRCGWCYIEPRSALELLTFLLGIVVLRRETVGKTLLLSAGGIVLGIALCLLLPFHFG